MRISKDEDPHPLDTRSSLVESTILSSKTATAKNTWSSHTSTETTLGFGSASEVLQYVFDIKIILTGDMSVGKTALLRRFCQDRDWDGAIANVGVDFRIKRVCVHEKPVRLGIWDTAGQERFRAMTKQYYRLSDGVLLVYDVGNRKSFTDLSNWFADLEKNLSPDEYARISKIVVGTKADKEEREVSSEEGEVYAASFGCGYVETSALMNMGVNDAFLQLSEQILERLFAESKALPHSRAVESTKKKETVVIGKDGSGGKGRGGCSC